MNYVTLHDVKEQLKLTATSDDTLLQKWISRSSRLIDWWKGRSYDVVKATRYFDVPSLVNSFGDYSTGERTARESLLYPVRKTITTPDLLEVVKLTNGNGEEITDTDYILKPYDEMPKSHILLKNGIYWTADSNGNCEKVISVEGYWGYNENYPKCFVDSGDTILNAGGLLANSTTIEVADVNGVANDLLSPRFSAGHVLKIESSSGIEFCLIITATAVSEANDILLVERGYNGTSPFAHPAGTAIKIYRPDERITQIALRLVQWRYRQKDQNVFDKIFDAGANQTIIPTAIPADVERLLGARKFVL